MIRVLMFLTVFTLLFSSSVLAHVTNEKSIYDDIEFSDAKEEIVYLRGLNVIPYEHDVHLFKPQDTLTKADLAFWAASFSSLGGHDAKKEDIQNEAINKNLVDSLEGNATYVDVSKAYFNGKANVENPEGELTKEEFALFMGKYLTEKVDGKTLFEIAGYEKGPQGVIEKVIVTEEKKEDSDEVTKRYTLVFNGKEYKVSAHPKVLNAPVDLAVWENKKIKESWIAGGHGEEKMLQIINVEKGQFTDKEIGSKPEGEKKHGTQNAEHTTEEQPEKGFPVIPVIGGIILVIVLGWLFLKKK